MAKYFNTAHHDAWLAAHPERTREWLSQRLTDGFDIHHADGNPDNNDPANLVLIDTLDHAKLHGGLIQKLLEGSARVRRAKTRKPKPNRLFVVCPWMIED